jgi:hypothetical protein
MAGAMRVTKFGLMVVYGLCVVVLAWGSPVYSSKLLMTPPANMTAPPLAAPRLHPADWVAWMYEIKHDGYRLACSSGTDQKRRWRRLHVGKHQSGRYRQRRQQHKSD